MNGAESLVRTLVRAGVDVCFANPGTSEMHFVAALDRVPEMRGVLCLFEGVATGMADGFGRMAERPAATLLHLGTGLANGCANLHNARKAYTPIVNIVGDHTRAHLQYPSAFVSDVAAIARPFSDWVRVAESSLTLSVDAALAVAAARSPPGQIATLIVPADTAWNPAETVAEPVEPSAAVPVDAQTLERIAGILESGRKVGLLLRGPALSLRALKAAARIAAHTGARLLCERLTTRTARGAGRVRLEQIPYRAEEAAEFLRNLDALIAVCSQPPVSTFAYPGKPSWLLSPNTTLAYLAHPHEDGVAALEALANRIGALRDAAPMAAEERPSLPRGALDQFTIGASVARHLPEGAIISDESVSNSAGSYLATRGAAPHDWLTNTGGAIGQGLPAAAGAAVACPDRKVVCLLADGGAMYTLQALWTLARERLDVTVVLFANRSYAILQMELARVGATGEHRARTLLELDRPDPRWTRLAEGMGVEASRAESTEQFDAQFAEAMRTRGPRLIEAVL
ncbi:MAG TPA: acetolactate synthase large subunit [Steroidobacteraceae bacterium]|nr:acetolactate synthase large subunit [Steroidobacteraceae bacterium]